MLQILMGDTVRNTNLEKEFTLRCPLVGIYDSCIANEDTNEKDKGRYQLAG